ncbi:MAG: hypothetical protein LBK94_11585 [Prevotellaceae bacterium]|jgi:hypothetical protein|nr:hypothetical protein [Prevotellaceae bacterium]
MKKLIFISILFICANVQQATAQETGNVVDSVFFKCLENDGDRLQLLAYCEDTAKQQKNSMARGDEHEKIREMLEARKKEYFTKEMKLTGEDAKVFFPVLDQFENKYRKIGRERKKLLDDFETEESSMTDARAKQINKQLYDLQKQEFDLMLEYEKIFETVLTPKQLFLFHKAHSNFMRGLIKGIGSKNRKNNASRFNFDGKL